MKMNSVPNFLGPRLKMIPVKWQPTHIQKKKVEGKKKRQRITMIVVIFPNMI